MKNISNADQGNAESTILLRVGHRPTFTLIDVDLDELESLRHAACVALAAALAILDAETDRAA